jgi:hypothetical protein
MKKILSNKLFIVTYLVEIALFILIICAISAPLRAATSSLSIHNMYSPERPLNPLSMPTPDPNAPQEISWPEMYISPTVEYGMRLVLPEAILNTLSVQPGYDRYGGLPTLFADWFVPVQMRQGRSIFLNPRLNLTGQRETASMAVGFRRMVTPNFMVGMHAFHDWARPRASMDRPLQEVGLGLEIEALTGLHSDLSFSTNAYFPINERFKFEQNNSVIVHEILPRGADARVSFLLPAMHEMFDARVDAEIHSYRGDVTDSTGYNVGVTLNSRDGVMSASWNQSKELGKETQYKVNWNFTLRCDWSLLSKGQNPFSAPYQASPDRYDRVIQQSLVKRVTRNYDLPTDRSEQPVTLHTRVAGDIVSFCGAIPDLPNSKLVVQTSRSPWQDHMEINTDSKGYYLGRIKLPPGKYKLRLVHKPTGKASVESSITIKK